MYRETNFLLGKLIYPEEFTDEMRSQNYRRKAAFRPLGRFIPNPKLKLREQVAEVCRFKHLSVRTEGAYWDWVRRLRVFHQPRPGLGVRSPLDG
jgi:hypothetical protein